MRLKLPDYEHCPKDGTKGVVIDSRKSVESRRRRRRCPVCGERWSTYETVVPTRRLRKIVREEML